MPYRDLTVPLPPVRVDMANYTPTQWSLMGNAVRAARSWLHRRGCGVYYSDVELTEMGTFILESPTGRQIVGADSSQPLRPLADETTERD